ncbi:MAG: DUF3990 domain-containing protein [Clostridiales bacterium]|nr:DUF3990 domain-containing protein [Clostridiales bacterium]
MAWAFAAAAERELSIVRFQKPDTKWLEFVCACRSGRKPASPYDMIFGPVSDDTVYVVIQLYENGILDKNEAIKRFKAQRLYNQILFHAEKALRFCRYKSHEVVRSENDGR